MTFSNANNNIIELINNTINKVNFDFFSNRFATGFLKIILIYQVSITLVLSNTIGITLKGYFEPKISTMGSQ